MISPLGSQSQAKLHRLVANMRALKEKCNKSIGRFKQRKYICLLFC